VSRAWDIGEQLRDRPLHVEVAGIETGRRSVRRRGLIQKLSL